MAGSNSNLPVNSAVGQMGLLARQLQEISGLSAMPLTTALTLFPDKAPGWMLMDSSVVASINSLNAIIPSLEPQFTASLFASDLQKLMETTIQPLTGHSVIPIDVGLNKSLALQLPNVSLAPSLTGLDLVTKAHGLFDVPFQPIQDMLNELSGTVELLSSNIFKNIQEILGVDIAREVDISSFLDTIVANEGTDLKEVLGESQEIDAAVEYLSGSLPFDQIPPATRIETDEVRNFITQNAIPVTVLVALIFNILWLINERTYESASALSSQLIVLLYALKEMQQNSGQ